MTGRSIALFYVHFFSWVCVLRSLLFVGFQSFRVHFRAFRQGGHVQAAHWPGARPLRHGRLQISLGKTNKQKQNKQNKHSLERTKELNCFFCIYFYFGFFAVGYSNVVARRVDFEAS
jgi:hypothetical protein